MTKPTLNLTVIALFVFCLVSCKEEMYFESTKVLEENQWTYQDTLDYTFDIVDTTTLYNLYLDINHSTEYSFQNIYIQVYTLFPSGKRIKERLPIDFANKTGRWFGNCDSDWCNLRVNLQEGAFFNAQGKHTITLEQFMRVETLQGIREMSLRLEDTKKKR